MKMTILLLLSLLHATPSQAEPVTVMFWNLENFFDYTDGGTSSSDAEFSSRGTRHWTRRRFQTKCHAVSKTVFAVADRYGQLPQVICLSEVENRGVLTRLLGTTLLRKCGYSIIHYDSPDPRGIDVAMLYRGLDTLCTAAIPVPGIPTRDILLSCFITASGDSLAVLANHHPSKFGGDSSVRKRAAAVDVLMRVVDVLEKSGFRSVVAIGDFNDLPSSSVYDSLNRRMNNLSLALEAAGAGTIRFSGKWELIDQCLVSDAISSHSRMEIQDFPFLTVPDSAYGGEKPFRTYSGPRYIAGVSDHYPIVVRIDQSFLKKSVITVSPGSTP